MKSLVKAELFLLSKSSGFKILLFCSFITGGLACATGIFGITNERTIGIDGIIAYQEAAFLIFGSIFTAIFICNGFKRRTYGLSLLSGNTRLQIFFAKFIVSFVAMFLLSIIMGTVPFIVALVNGTINSCRNGVSYVLMRLIYAWTGFMAQYSVDIFLAVAVKNGTLTNIIGISFKYVLLVIIANMSFYEEPAIEPYVRYTYLYQVEMFWLREDGFSSGIYLAVTILTFIVSLCLSAWIFVKRELK